jgi:hypothetical protein
MALIAPFAHVARSTNRSTSYDACTVCQLQNVTAAPDQYMSAPASIMTSRPVQQLGTGLSHLPRCRRACAARGARLRLGGLARFILLLDVKGGGLG